MHSATSLQGSGLVRTVGPCAQTRVAIETHEWHEVLHVSRGLLSRPPSLERSKRRGGLFFVIPINNPVDSALAHFFGEFEHLLLACSEGCGLCDIIDSKFVCYYLHMHTVLTEIMDFL